MIEPLTVAVYASKRSKISVGKDLLITGAGPIGLLNTMVAKALEANQVLVTDINEDRLKLAKKIGTDHTVLVNSHTKEEKLINKVKQLFGKEVEISIECSGAPSSLILALLATKKATTLIVGNGPNEVNLPLFSQLFARSIFSGHSVIVIVSCYL
jgi:L-iditol 2-dehydrogenase